MIRSIAILLLAICVLQTAAQKKCKSAGYLEKMITTDPGLKSRMEEIESFTQKNLSGTNTTSTVARVRGVITIPVVFHVLYHLPGENISTEVIASRINALNRDFRRKNADTVNTPKDFKKLAADMEIEFQLATTDPHGRMTNGIIKKYTPVHYWLSDDKMKFGDSWGEDAWDTKSYLNIWVCNMQDVMGYSSLPGLDAAKDGIVISTSEFNGNFGKAVLGRTLVHEAGHWLNLYHIWGDSYCGDDKVDDTPKQSIYTPGCPSGARLSCSSGPDGDMYMNYMDFTDDGCMNMFTEGQKNRARALFETGGIRNSILFSKGLNVSQVPAAQLPDFYPQWFIPKIYPNPATNQLNVYLEYDERWIGKEIKVLDISGRVVINKTIYSKIFQLDISKLNSGTYVIYASKNDETIEAKFVKL